jgi:mycoredoxin
MAEAKIIVYGTEWCGDCRRVQTYFKQNNIDITWINIDRDPQADAFVRSVNRGNRSVPTIIFPDGSRLVEPSTQALAAKLATLSA